MNQRSDGEQTEERQEVERGAGVMEQLGSLLKDLGHDLGRGSPDLLLQLGSGCAQVCEGDDASRASDQANASVMVASLAYQLAGFSGEQVNTVLGIHDQSLDIVAGLNDQSEHLIRAVNAGLRLSWLGMVEQL
jgi:hypothetical protein